MSGKSINRLSRRAWAFCAWMGFASACAAQASLDAQQGPEPQAATAQAFLAMGSQAARMKSAACADAREQDLALSELARRGDWLDKCFGFDRLMIPIRLTPEQARKNPNAWVSAEGEALVAPAVISDPQRDGRDGSMAFAILAKARVIQRGPDGEPLIPSWRDALANSQAPGAGEGRELLDREVEQMAKRYQGMLLFRELWERKLVAFPEMP